MCPVFLKNGLMISANPPPTDWKLKLIAKTDFCHQPGQNDNMFNEFKDNNKYKKNKPSVCHFNKFLTFFFICFKQLQGDNWNIKYLNPFRAQAPIHLNSFKNSAAKNTEVNRKLGKGNNLTLKNGQTLL